MKLNLTFLHINRQRQNRGEGTSAHLEERVARESLTKNWPSVITCWAKYKTFLKKVVEMQFLPKKLSGKQTAKAN